MSEKKKLKNVDMQNLSKEEKEFLDSFEAGTYVEVSIFVTKDNFKHFLQHLAEYENGLVVNPKLVNEEFEFLMMDEDDIDDPRH